MIAEYKNGLETLRYSLMRLYLEWVFDWNREIRNRSIPNKKQLQSTS